MSSVQACTTEIDLAESSFSPSPAVSAPVALLGGLGSLLFGGVLFFWWRPLPAVELARFSLVFTLGWSAIFTFIACAQFFEVRLEVTRREISLPSPGRNRSLSAMFPPMLVGAFASTAFFCFSPHLAFFLPAVWMICHGLGLLAAKTFSPPSTARLGLSFLCFGCFTLFVLFQLHWLWGFYFDYWYVPTAANLFMAASFGLFHLVYAACTWPRGTNQGGLR